MIHTEDNGVGRERKLEEELKMKWKEVRGFLVYRELSIVTMAFHVSSFNEFY